MRHPRTTIVAAADMRPEALGLCESWSARALQRLSRVAGEREADLVSVCTWTHTHPELTIAAAEAGVKGILCEKPMSAHSGDARRAALAAPGIPLAIHHQRRLPCIAAARKKIAAGAIGTPLAGWWRTIGAFLNNGTHGVDLHRYLIGDPAPSWVMAQLERRTNRYERGLYVEDCITATIAYENGYRMTIEVDVEPKPSGFWYVFGSEGSLRLTTKDAVLIGRGEPSCWQPSQNRVRSTS